MSAFALRGVSRRRPQILRAAAACALVLPLATLSAPALAASQIVLNGSVSQNCTMNVTTDANAANLNLTGATQHIVVGTVVQNCNKKTGYTVVVSSANCAPAPNGAKMMGTTSGDTLSYTVESVNPSTGGSGTDVTNLLSATCTSQNARTVNGAKISNETSTIYVNYTGNAALAADTYQDTLTFTMNVN